MILLMMLHALWALSIPLTKSLIQRAQDLSLFFLSVRLLVAGSIMGFVSILYYKEIPKFSQAHWFFYGIIILTFYAKYILRSTALRFLLTVDFAFLIQLSPLCILLGEAWSNNRMLTPRQYKGIFLGALAILIVHVYRGNFLHYYFWCGFCATLLEIILYTCSTIYIRNKLRLAQAHNPLFINAVRSLVSGSLLMITAMHYESLPESIASLWLLPQLNGIGTTLLLILVSNCIAHTLYLHVLRTYSISTLMVSEALSPVFVALYGWLFCAEPCPSYAIIFTVLLLIIVLYFVYIPHNKQLALE